MSWQTETRSVASARTSHRCSWCDTQVDKGSSYKRYRYYGSDGPGTVKMHPECYDAMLKTVEEEHGPIEFSPGDNPRGCNCGFDKACNHNWTAAA